MEQKISVIIPTLHRLNSLREMLHSLLNQTVLPDEVIIVDQSKNDESKFMVEELFNDYKKVGVNNVVLKYIHNPNLTGAAQARNKGIEEAIGDIVFFFDDDVILEKDYTYETMMVYRDYPNVAGIGGVIINYNFLNNFFIKLFNNVFRQGVFKDCRGELFANYKSYSTPIAIDRLSGGCASYKKSVIEFERFDESFDNILNGYSFGEDIELSLRISRNYQLLITPKAMLVHNSVCIKDRRRSKEDYIFLEVSSWTYIFLKNFKFNFKNWLTYLWLCLGWALIVISNVIKGNFRAYQSFLRGLRKGVKI